MYEMQNGSVVFSTGPNAHKTRKQAIRHFLQGRAVWKCYTKDFSNTYNIVITADSSEPMEDSTLSYQLSENAAIDYLLDPSCAVNTNMDRWYGKLIDETAEHAEVLP